MRTDMRSYRWKVHCNFRSLVGSHPALLDLVVTLTPHAAVERLGGGCSVAVGPSVGFMATTIRTEAFGTLPAQRNNYNAASRRGAEREERVDYLHSLSARRIDELTESTLRDRGDTAQLV